MPDKNRLFAYFLLLSLIVIFVLQLNNSQLFLAQLNLSETGLKLFSVSKGDGKTFPSFTVCKADDLSCTREIKVRFVLDNGDVINQLSLENGTVKNFEGKDVQLSIKTDPAKTILLAKKGESTTKGLSLADFPIDPKDAIYLKGTTGVSFLVPEESKGYDFFNLGYWIKESSDIKIPTFEVGDSSGKVFVAVPSFLSDRIGGEEMADFIQKTAQDINEKIAKALGVEKVPYYLIVTPSVLAPDFYRSTYYTASGMAYVSNIDMASKYGINFEKTFAKCTLPGDYSKTRCFEDNEVKSKLTYLLYHELSHLYQYKRGNLATNTSGRREAFWEAGAEINALSLINANNYKAQIKAKFPVAEKCNQLGDEHKIGLCMISNFLSDLDADKIKSFFNLSKKYDFGSDPLDSSYCDTWYGVLSEITGKTPDKKIFDEKICLKKIKVK